LKTLEVRRMAYWSTAVQTGPGGRIGREADLGLLVPDILLPVQAADRRSSAARSGEQRLMLAVLGEAVHTYRTLAGAQSPRARRLYREAETWFAERDARWPFAFENVCAALGIDAERLRSGLRAWGEGAPYHRLRRA
jgi:hypothetical protein